MEKGKGLPFGMRFFRPLRDSGKRLWLSGGLCPAGTDGKGFVPRVGFAALRVRGLFLCFLFGPPARRAADGGLLGAAAPPRPPLHSPRTTPLGFPYSTNRQVSSALTSDNPVGLSNFCQPARAARLLLRELPSLRSGDLPARRAMPPPPFALNTNTQYLHFCFISRYGERL